MVTKKQKRVHILSAVNAANVSKSGGTYTIKDVCGATDDIVMNSRLYPADQLAAGASSLDGKPAPAGHPKNAAGQHISALNGEALASAWIGSYCRNARHEAGRTVTDILVNEAQARATPAGLQLCERLDAAIAGTNADPIHVSTGLFFEEIRASGESRGKKYTSIATNLRYDHLAILLRERGAGTPEEGVGMFLNTEGEPEQVEAANAATEPEDRRGAGLFTWIRRLLGNADADLSFDQIASSLQAQLPGGAWPREVFQRYVIWVDNDGKLWKQDYAIGSDASVALIGQPVGVTRKVEYEPITNQEKGDIVKDKILAALNAAGISVAGMDDAQLLTAYNAIVTKPVAEALNAANSKVAGFEVNARAAEDAEISGLATELAVNGSLTVDDLKKLGLPRLKELKGAGKAAPVVVAAANQQAADEFAGYDLNSF